MQSTTSNEHEALLRALTRQRETSLRPSRALTSATFVVRLFRRARPASAW
jgi:hypothetical protein